MLRPAAGLLLLHPSKCILQGSSETKPWLKAGFGGVGWALGSPVRWRRRVWDGEAWGVLVKNVTKVSTLSQKLLPLGLLRETVPPSQGRTPLCSVLSSQSLKYPRVALRGNGDRKAQLTDVEFR